MRPTPCLGCSATSSLTCPLELLIKQQGGLFIATQASYLMNSCSVELSQVGAALPSRQEARRIAALRPCRGEALAAQRAMRAGKRGVQGWCRGTRGTGPRPASHNQQQRRCNSPAGRGGPGRTHCAPPINCSGAKGHRRSQWRGRAPPTPNTRRAPAAGGVSAGADVEITRTSG